MRPPHRLIALLAPAALVLALADPVKADDPLDLPDAAKSAITEVDKSLVVKAPQTHEASVDSDVVEGEKVHAESASFRASGKVLSVERQVGAVRRVEGSTATGRRVARKRVDRGGEGDREVVVSSTADEWGPGLTIAEWTERDGVNYRLVARGAVDTAALLKVAEALPEDTTQPSRAVRKAVRTAKPAKARAQRGTGNQILDGAGAYNDDFNDEATLCNGCAYSNSNYTGLWQYMMWADGSMAYSQIDCSFGSATETSTRNWKSSHGVGGSDGVFGPNARNVADNNIAGYNGEVLQYIGWSTDVYVFRSASSGHYHYNSNSARINYSGASLPAC